jgi:hypothetical protein
VTGHLPGQRAEGTATLARCCNAERCTERPTTRRYGCRVVEEVRNRNGGPRAERAPKRPTVPEAYSAPEEKVLPVPLICTICSPGTTPGDRPASPSRQ